MKKNYPIFILSILLAAGSMFSSCVKDTHGDKTDPDDKETRCLALNVNLDNLTTTRANGSSTGIEQESQIYSIRIILYNSAGLAEYVDSYRIYLDYTNDWRAEAETGYDGVITNAGILTYEGPDKPISMFYPEIENKPYTALVITNYDNLSNLYYDFSSYDNYYGYTGNKGHSIDVFSTPIDLLAQYNGTETPSYTNEGMINALYDKGWRIMAGTGYGLYSYYSTPTKSDFNNSMNWIHLLMMNADGPVEISTSQLYSDSDQAKANPVKINIERAVAKVALFDQLPATLKHGATVAGQINWATDIMNNKIYLLRQKAPLGGGLGVELPTSPRKYRYALDPNYTGISAERQGGGGSGQLVSENFSRSYLKEFRNIMFRTANPNTESPTSDAHEWTYWDYLPENTMSAVEQYEDVTTRLIVKLNYVPAAAQIISVPAGSGGTIDGTSSYYSYKNKLIFTVNDMNALGANASETAQKIEDTKALVTGADADEIKGLLDELKTVLPAVASTFNNFNTVLTSAVSAKGLNFHHLGVSYYGVPLRHFDDSVEGTPMGYGRYGVVRNNVYKVVLTNINGPGSAVVPEPEGPVDKDPQIKSNIYITDWTNKGLNFDL